MNAVNNSGDLISIKCILLFLFKGQNLLGKQRRLLLLVTYIWYMDTVNSRSFQGDRWCVYTINMPVWPLKLLYVITLWLRLLQIACILHNMGTLPLFHFFVCHNLSLSLALPTACGTHCWRLWCGCGLCVCCVCKRAFAAAAVPVLHLFLSHQSGVDGLQALQGLSPTLSLWPSLPPKTHKENVSTKMIEIKLSFLPLIYINSVNAVFDFKSQS